MKYDKWIPVVFLMAYLVRIVILGTIGISDSLVILFLSTLYGWRMYLDFQAKPDPHAQMAHKLNEVELELASLKNAMNVVKLTTGIKNERSSFKF